ncbi:52 kDa repressor of the inhibitor of the protein kinase-like [Macrosteles quadrilineatus]|uniref:52 kDa repressor of the inhibitor of the protein kinase-like n=1 Tax=Macrosteles quadrilineatus TaxID=74068 RepID=UPI0023E0A633|nr:52 kDa repressor of the inhibitor of the protein kinase-like [Macrosteles quadrilineatus]
MDIRNFFKNKRLKVDEDGNSSNQPSESLSLDKQDIERSIDSPQPRPNLFRTDPSSDKSSNEESSCHGNIDQLNPGPSVSGSYQNPSDIGSYTDRSKIDSLNDRTKYLLLQNPWKPDKTYNYKADVTPGKRQFLHDWFNLYEWMAYSKNEKGVFCKTCVIFRPRVSRGLQGAFITRPFTNYKKFHECAKSHMASEWHRESSEKASNFMSVMNNKQLSVEAQVNDQVQTAIEQNRTKLKSILSTVIFCATHDLPLRGKTDEGAVFNDLLHFREESGDKVLQEHLKTAPKNAKYISHGIQNELIDTCATTLRSDLVRKIKDNEFFSILADETMDIGGTEQLSLGVRYYNREEKIVKEEFLGFTPLQNGVDAETIANAITDTLTGWKLNLELAVGQGYDGCSTMAGEISGVHKRISTKFPMANFYHCASHRLNLAINDVSDIPQIRNTVGTIKEVTKFFRENSGRRSVVGTLQNLCETRWTEKYKSIRKFRDKFIDIVNGLETLSKEGNKDTKQKAFQLYCAVTSSTFVVSLEIVAKYSATLETVAQMLQGVNVDLMRVAKHIERLVDLFKEDRKKDEVVFKDLMANVDTTTEVLGISLTRPRTNTKQSHRSNVPSESVEDYYRKSLFIPYLDYLIRALSERFSKKNQTSFELFNLHPLKMKAMTRTEFENSLNDILVTYSNVLDNFKIEGLLCIFAKC